MNVRLACCVNELVFKNKLWNGNFFVESSFLLPVLYFYWSLYPVAAIVLSGGFVSVITYCLVLQSQTLSRTVRPGLFLRD